MAFGRQSHSPRQANPVTRAAAAAPGAMGKRKADEAGLPDRLSQQPAPSKGTGPFLVYFPSRFQPNGDIACEWQAYAHRERRNQYVVVGQTVSGSSMRWRAGGQRHCSAAEGAPPAAAARRRSPPLARRACDACLHGPRPRRVILKI